MAKTRQTAPSADTLPYIRELIRGAQRDAKDFPARSGYYLLEAAKTLGSAPTSEVPAFDAAVLWSQILAVGCPAFNHADEQEAAMFSLSLALADD